MKKNVSREHVYEIFIELPTVSVVGLKNVKNLNKKNLYNNNNTRERNNKSF